MKGAAIRAEGHITPAPRRLGAGWAWCLLLWASICGSATARADCLKPPLELLWSYPAEGQHDVPLDATFWVLASQGAGTPPVSATLDGQSVPALSTQSDQQLGQAAFRPEALRPDSAYELRVTYHADDDSSDTFAVRFHTGAKTAGDAKTTVRGQQSRSVAFIDEHPCSRLLSLQGCFDSPDQQLRLQTFVLESANVLGWYVKARGAPALQFWPAACGHPTVVETSDSACHYLYGIDLRGELSTLTQYCGPATQSSQVFSTEAAPSYAGVRKPTTMSKPVQRQAAAPQPAPAPVHRARDQGCAGCNTSEGLNSGMGFTAGLLAVLLIRARWRRARSSSAR